MGGMPDWAKGNKAYEAFFEASTRANFTPEETIQYEKDMMAERDRINSINYARWEGAGKARQKAANRLGVKLLRHSRPRALMLRQSLLALDFLWKKSMRFRKRNGIKMEESAPARTKGTLLGNNHG